MEGKSVTGHIEYSYHNPQWSRFLRRNSGLATANSTANLSSNRIPPPPQLDSIPQVLPYQTSVYQAQLVQYNKLIAAGTVAKLQSSPLPPQLSAEHIHAVSGSRSGQASAGPKRRARDNLQSGHGNKVSQSTGNGERSLITGESRATMSSNTFDLPSTSHPNRPLMQHARSNISHQSSSVPSTPHQHPRDFTFGSREPSPNALPNHSPRSVYSESNSTLPSLKPLPPKFGRGCRYETAMAHSRRRMAYSIGTDPLDKVKPENIKAKLDEDEEKRLSGDMRDLYEKLLPSQESETRRQKFVVKLEKLLNDEWPGHDIRVHMFGSSGNLLCTDESDVDICITTPWKELEGVCMLAELLAKHGMEKVICVSTAKVPIVKVWDPELSLACDMNVNNTLALENTRMIKIYVEVDKRVRPLAMIIKHWTKRRLVNDAAFGGTLSSYTWICMIISFLQTRKPPVLPSLHQRPHQKLPPRDGVESPFADDVEALSSYGKDNHESLGELLFGFFRYYGHELDYDTSVISVRSGKIISKTDKRWHVGNNNRLCVEEPFNTSRNLGNTADDTSWRGLHIEIRRAFDLISEGKLDACCEEYVFPKEEEKIWQRPAPQPRPVVSISRSSSQNGRGGRGGHNRGGRTHQFGNRGSSGNRRASSGAFDHNPANYLPQAVPQNLTPEQVWIQTQNAQTQLHNDLYTTFSVLQAQENSLRLQLYTQSQAYAAQAYNARLNPNGHSATSQPTERSSHRAGSFDNPPLTAPISRPDMYYYPLQFQTMTNYQQPSPSTYPSSPSIPAAVPELRRSLHRSTVTGGTAAGTGMSSSSLRSHSQPAARSVPSPLALQGSNGSGHGINGLTAYNGLRQANNMQMHGFSGDENSDRGYDVDSLSNSAITLGDSPPEMAAPREYVGYYVNGTQPMMTQRTTPLAIPSFNDGKPVRRRPSTDHFPQAAIYDRLRRSSRSPSPMGNRVPLGSHSAPLSAVSSQHQNGGSYFRSDDRGPLVVNGSSYGSQISYRHPSTSESSASEASGLETVTGADELFYQDVGFEPSTGPGQQLQPGQYEEQEACNNQQISLADGPDLTTNHPAYTTVPQSTEAQPNATAGFEHTPGVDLSLNGISRLSPNSRLRLTRQQQNSGMVPLGTSGLDNIDALKEDLPHLSPVYETRSPSPNASRKVENSAASRGSQPLSSAPDNRSYAPKQPLKQALANSTAKQSGQSGRNGHTRAAKSEGGLPGTWQKIPNKKKKGGPPESKNGGNGHSVQNEKPPKHESERKGG